MKFKFNLILITFILLLTNSLTNAQQQCGIELLEEQVQYMNDTRSDRANTNISLFSNSEETINLQLAIHIVRDGRGEQGLHLDSLSSAMEDLNNTFEPANFRFHICSIDYIDNDLYVEGAVKQAFDSNSVEYEMATPYLKKEAIDVFFVPVLSSNLSGWSSFPGYENYYEKDWMVIGNAAANNGSTLAHEIGHYFSLYHSHQGSHDVLGWGDELVNGSNCGPNVGDEICDTPADPTGLKFNSQGSKFHIAYCTEYYSCTFSNENVEGGCGFTDSNGDLYKPNANNVMSYNYAHCRTQFSPQQIDRMQQSYLFDRDYLSNYCQITCDNLYTVYDWLENKPCQKITVYKYNSELNFLDVQNDEERNLYLSNGDFYCSGSAVDGCITQLGLMETLIECNTEDCPGNIYGCMDLNACNYDPDATNDDDSCTYPETNFNCAGDCLIIVDCENVCGGIALQGTACDDGDALTTNDQYDNDCNCKGQPIPEPTESCKEIFDQYVWLENEVACNSEEITVFEYDGWKFIKVEAENETTLYLSGDSNKYLEICDENIETKTILDECVCSKECTQYGCTDEQAVNYNPNADCDDGSCQYINICDDPKACNFGENGMCDYGNANCSDPCYESTCGGKCDDVFTSFPWLLNKADPNNCSNQEITVYSDGNFYFVYIKTTNQGDFYLDSNNDGTYYGQDNGDYYYPNAYGYDEIAKWTCGCNMTNNQALKTVLPIHPHAFTMFPNPAKEMVEIELSNNTESLYTITVYNLSGGIIKQSSFTGKQTSLNVSDLSKGMYMIEIYDTQNIQDRNIQKLLIE